MLYDIETSASSNERFLALHTEDREIVKPLGRLGDWITTAVAESMITNLDQMTRNEIMYASDPCNFVMQQREVNLVAGLGRQFECAAARTSPLPAPSFQRGHVVNGGGGRGVAEICRDFLCYFRSSSRLAVGCVFALVFLWRLRKNKRGFADSRPFWFAYWEPRSEPRSRGAAEPRRQ